MLTNEEFEGSARAGTLWVSTRDVPDSVGWADFRHSAELTAETWRRRRAAGIVCNRVHPFVIPKGLDANREISVVEPLDELAYRALVGRVLLPIEMTLGPEVKSYRMADPPSAWRLKKYKYGISGRLEDLRGHVLSSGFGGVATLDIASYYPSIAVLLLSRSLAECGAEPSNVSSIVETLTDWHDIWGVKGLPIGPEASGVLGNVPLVPVDRLLRSLGVGFSRYTDDYWIHLHRGIDHVALLEAVNREVEALGLSLNASKTRVLFSRAEVQDDLVDPEIADLVQALADNRGKGLSRVTELFHEAATAGDSRATRLKFCLGVMTSARDLAALDVAMRNERVMRIDPGRWGRYFKALIDSKRMDLDWLLALALRVPTPDLAAVQLHALLALRTTSLPASAGSSMSEFVCATGNWIPLRAAAADAWARTERVNASHIGDAAIEIGDPYQRRAVTLSLRRWKSSRRRDVRLDKLERVAPDLQPSVRWIRAGAGLDVGLRAA